MSFTYHNGPTSAEAPPSPLPQGFTLKAAPTTDLWRKPPAHITTTAPLCTRSIPLSTFRSARATITADWKTLFDQGGLCLILPQNKSRNLNDAKWVKTGIEVFNGKPHVSTVACDRWADWGLYPLEGGSVTVEMEREVVEGKKTCTLWVYIVKGEERTPVRETTWVFEKEEGECWVGVYAAKPTRDEADGEKMLVVKFDDVKIETFQ